MLGQLCESCSGTGEFAEKIHEDSFRNTRILINKNTDGFVSLQRLDHGARGISFVNQAISRERAPILYEIVDKGVIEGPNHDAHGLRHKCVGKSAQLPVPQMRRGDQNTAAFALGRKVVVETVIRDPVANILAVQTWKPRDRDQHTCDAFEYSINNALSLRGIELGKCESEVCPGHMAQPWKHNVKHPCSGVCSGAGGRKWQQPESVYQCPRQGVLSPDLKPVFLLRQLWSLFDPTAAKHEIAVVKDRCLSWRDRTLRLIEANFDP